MILQRREMKSAGEWQNLTNAVLVTAARLRFLLSLKRFVWAAAAEAKR